MNDVHSTLNEALAAFFDKAPKTCKAYGNGHINDTFLVINEKKYVLQRINSNVFPNPVELLGNMAAVTAM